MTSRGTDLCPLCGGPNGCAMAAGAADAATCWCVNASFPPHLLARIPADRLGVACVCASCAASPGTASTGTTTGPCPPTP